MLWSTLFFYFSCHTTFGRDLSNLVPDQEIAELENSEKQSQDQTKQKHQADDGTKSLSKECIEDFDLSLFDK